MAIMPSRNQKLFGAIAAEGSALAPCILWSFFRTVDSESEGYLGCKDRSASGDQWRSKSTLLYFPNGPTILQRVSSPAERASWSRSMLAPSHAADTSANLRLKAKRFWAAAAAL